MILVAERVAAAAARTAQRGLQHHHRHRPRPSGCPLLACLLAAGALAACQPAGQAQQVVKFTGPTMGSSYQISYVAESGAPGLAAAQAGVQAILGEIDAAVSTYRADSALARFNAAPAGSCMDMPAAAIALAEHAQALHAASGGAFDVSLLPALEAWGFRHRPSAPVTTNISAGVAAAATSPTAPTEAELQALRQRVGMQHLRVEGARLCKSAPIRLEFNSTAAGYAVDRVAQWLEGQGVRNYLVEITGEMRAAGSKPGGAPWRIAIEAPLENARQAQKILALQDMTLSTSGDYRNWREAGGQRYSHTLDARSLRPVRHALASVTVAHASALQADGLSTLLMALGPEAGYDYASAHGLAALFITRTGESKNESENGGFATRSTAAFDVAFPSSVSGAQP
ncbi:FAD:protein FMN transferase [Allofranklinella schreckenbergeri]|uniref:FAD:protein FMN transferase n=1 Tax=Allofranklinella schreckenbergeri TaxID=1076744 RepID=A0A3M6Q8H6_9BURK|nr:FAD:protein FMN transferase [Allofranklinella schreckenbergeri]